MAMTMLAPLLTIMILSPTQAVKLSCPMSNKVKIVMQAYTKFGTLSSFVFLI